MRQEFPSAASLGFDPRELRPAKSVTNQVWLADDYVLKISSGRFRQALWHERRVLELIWRHAAPSNSSPFPAVLRYGTAGRGEWLTMGRAAGRSLRQDWAGLPAAQRVDALSQAGHVLRRLHAVPAAGIEPPWLRYAITHRDAADIYHCPFGDYGVLLAAAPAGSTAARWQPRIASQLGECAAAFAATRTVLAHGDVHFGNLMWSGGRLSALLDFEGAQPAPADQELDTLLQQIWHPSRFGIPCCNHSEAERDAMVSALLRAYPGLFTGAATNIRLAAYRIMTWLNETHHDPERGQSRVIETPQITAGRNGGFHTYLLPVDMSKPHLRRQLGLR